MWFEAVAARRGPDDFPLLIVSRRWDRTQVRLHKRNQLAVPLPYRRVCQISELQAAAARNGGLDDANGA
jgi:hypothetical protein